jgi:predicted transcriptional regulator
MEKEKSSIQEVVNLLEDNGFHVFKAEEETPDELTARKYRKGTILLRIVRDEDIGGI